MLEAISRNTSAPYCSVALTARTTLPIDLDIFSPLSSTTKPWVSTFSNGALPVEPTAVRIDDWNQPRCWSEPSRYMNAGKPRPKFCASTARWLEPDSNQTSRMSPSFRNEVPPHFGHAAPGGASSWAGRVNQQSAPCWRNRSRKWRTVWAVSNWVLQVVQPRAGIGTPHDRWRLMHQSGRSDTMASIRDWPQLGSHFTSPIDLRVRP